MTKKNLILIISVIFIGLLVVFASYSFWSWSSDVDKSILFNTANDISNYVNYVSGTPQFEGDFVATDNFKNGMHTTISISKTSEVENLDLYATINMTVNQISNNMETIPGVKWVVTEGNASATNPTILSTGNFLGTNNNDVLELYPNIEVTLTEEEYTIWIWIDESENPGSAFNSETLDTDVWVQVEQFVRDKLEITSINGVYPNITATAINSNKNITDYAVTLTSAEPTTWKTIDTVSQRRIYNLNVSNYDVAGTTYDITAFIPNTTYYVWIKDSAGNIKSETVTIAKRPITITAKAQTINYGSSIATGVGQVTTNSTTSISGLASGHSIDAITLTQSRTTVGTGTITPSEATIENATITGYYNITYATGTLTIIDSLIAITTQPTNKSVEIGTSVTFTVAASGTNLLYQWYEATTLSEVGTLINGATNSSYTLTTTELNNAKYYYCTVYNGADNVDSNRALLNTWWDISNAGDDSVKATFSLDPDNSSMYILEINGNSNMTNYADYADAPWYNYRTSISNVIFNNGITSIGNKSFYGITHITSITIPDSVTYIGNYAFYGCTGVTESIEMSQNVTSIGSNPFLNVITPSINVNVNNQYYSSENGILFNKAKTAIITYPRGKTDTSYTIPNTVTSINAYSFYRSQLINIEIPSIVRTISTYAFGYNTLLQTVNIKSTSLALGTKAFSNAKAGSVINVINETIASKFIDGTNYTAANTTINCPPVITTHPSNVSISYPDTATFSVVTSDNSNTTTYQWQYRTSSDGNWANVTANQGVDGTTASFTTVASSLIMVGYQYRCIVGNNATVALGLTIASNPATLSIVQAITNYSSSGTYTYPVTAAGLYRIELWGAQGGTRDNQIGGYGGYVAGEIYLHENENLTIDVGGQGVSTITSISNPGGYNGGGYSGSLTGVYSFGGGGATDIRFGTDEWNTNTALNSRIMVAGGGGGNVYDDTTIVSGAAGGLIGGMGTALSGKYSAVEYNTGGGTQTSVGVIASKSGRSGKFGMALQTTVSGYGGGGGGGYYGGAMGYGTGGGGGSSYISGHTGCIAISSGALTNTPRTARTGTNNATCTTETTDNLCSIHYSNKKFMNTLMIDGNGYSWSNEIGNLMNMPNPAGGTFASGRGKSGEGYARITYITAIEPQYRITYALNGGNAVNPGSYSSNSGNITLNIPIKAGYDFAGWTGSNGTTPQKNVTIPTGSTGDKNYVAHWMNVKKEYSEKGSYSYTVARDGLYKIELWGAQGGTRDTLIGGYGGYTSGKILLSRGDVLNFYVGEQGVSTITSVSNPGGYNGGGYGGSLTNVYSFGGGGATDVRLTSGNWNNETSLNSRIMIAAGGGGHVYNDTTIVPGEAGGLVGEMGTALSGKYSAEEYNTYGGTQTSGGTNAEVPGKNGLYGKGIQTTVGGYGGGGGGGYYGGATGHGTGGGGGSSYISGHTGCVAITASDNTAARVGTGNATCITGTTDNLCSVHYSNKIFSYTKMIDGDGYSWSNEKGNLTDMPNPAGGTFASGTGKTGNGYAKITALYFDDLFNYNITYNLNGGIIDGDNPLGYNIISSNVTLINPTKTGYAFAGWTGSNGTTPQITLTIPIGSTGNKEYIANWIDNTAPVGTATLKKESLSSLKITVNNIQEYGIGMHDAEPYSYAVSTSSDCSGASYIASTNTSYTFTGPHLMDVLYYGCVILKDKNNNIRTIITPAAIIPTDLTYQAISLNYCCGTASTCNDNSYYLKYVVDSSNGNNSCSIIDDGGGNYRVKFLKTGNLTLTVPATLDIFLVGGGGGGGSKLQQSGGGGGYTQTFLNYETVVNESYRIIVGLGGNPQVAGGVSSFASTENTVVSANGGLPGGSTAYDGGAGGSGGGAGGSADHGGQGGSNGTGGGADNIVPSTYIGASYVDIYNRTISGGTGQGTTTREFGESSGSLYAGGGGGGSQAGRIHGAGGAGGGGAGGQRVGTDSGDAANCICVDCDGHPGVANTGGGGGGSAVSSPCAYGGKGGDGIVIIRNHFR